MIFSIIVCIACFWWLSWLLRRDGLSLGLPIAYMFGLLLLHLPGAIAHAVGGDRLQNSDLTEIGIGFTAIGAVSFVLGVWIAHRRREAVPPLHTADHQDFWWFCFIGGWIFTLVFSLSMRIPTISAGIDKGGTLWLLGVLLGLQAAFRRRDIRWILFWSAAMWVYPVLMLLFGGFMSYGSTAVSIVLAGLAISVRSGWRVAIGAIVVAVLGLNVFVNYFQGREELRGAVWGGAPLEERVSVVADIVRNFEWIEPTNDSHIAALDQRLNQNFFSGLSAERIHEGQSEFRYGHSLWEGVMALVPRILWPDKPVFAGSPKVVAETTGLLLNEDTAWGVGNVMEFYINFGIPGLIGGFFVLGWALGTLDRKAATAECTGDFGRAILFFLPAVALVNPIGSMVELMGGTGAAAAAGYGWKWLWDRRMRRRRRQQRTREAFATRLR